MIRHIARVVLPAIVALSIAGCPKPAAEQGTGGTQPPVGVARPSSSDGRIAAAVKAKLAGDSSLRAERIDVTVKDGRVALSGTVSDGSIRIQAESAARSVDDVFGVDAEKLVVK